MKDLTHNRGTALIIITHNLGVVARYADKVIVMYAGRIIEKALTRDLYRRPMHPYTMGLMESVPRLDQDIRKKLISIEGQPPDLACLPSRVLIPPPVLSGDGPMQERTPDCSEKLSDNHEVACWIGA